MEESYRCDPLLLRAAVKQRAKGKSSLFQGHGIVMTGPDNAFWQPLLSVTTRAYVPAKLTILHYVLKLLCLG